MKNTLQLTRGEKDIMGSDGIMKMDGRFNMESVKEKVRLRNFSFKEKFPHKIADGFFFTTDRLKKNSIHFKL